MTNPYLISGPALISFSGGRTSAFMLKQIVDAHGGHLPSDIHVTFANTGKEREETLRFVYECGSRFGVKITWLEWADTDVGFEEVGFNSASRNGEPFAALIAKKGYLPNSVTRFCTTELKIRVMRDFCRSLGWSTWTNVIGLRYDEGHRVLKALERSDSGKEPWRNYMPLSKAKVTERDVLEFFLGPSMRVEHKNRPQGFDLELMPCEGNCDLCFLKGAKTIGSLMRDFPELADWWIERENSIIDKSQSGARFRMETTYAGLLSAVRRQPSLFDGDLASEAEQDTECGLVCAPMGVE